MSASLPAAHLIVSRDGRPSDRLFLQLARALASSGPNSGVAIDQNLNSTVARLALRPRTLLEAIEPAVRSLAIDRSPHDPPLVDLPPRWSARFGVLSVASGTEGDFGSTHHREGPSRGLPNPMTLRGSGIDTRTFWVPRAQGGLWVARTYRLVFPLVDRTAPWVDLAGPVLAHHWSTMLGRPCVPRELSTWTGSRAWKRGSSDAVPKDEWTPMEAERAGGGAEIPRPAYSVPAVHREPGHLSVFGTSGAGKTSFLAELASEAIRKGESVVAIDLHGDLTPGIVSRLTAGQRDRVLAIDVANRPVPGINVLGASSRPEDDRSAAQLVSALKRLSPDGEGIYWGFRLERIFDSFIRLVQEEGGSLVDLAAALQSRDRREALRSRTRRPELARFLDELVPVLQRQPDFLWPAAARLSKIVLVPALRELMAPEGLYLAWEEGLHAGRSLLIRLPFAEIGSEAAALASTLLLTRIYLARAASAVQGDPPRPVLLVLDEGHAFSPRLLAEILTEGRKFGVRAVLSTQYPERLSPEIEHAVRGAVSTHVCFRVPSSNARPTVAWLGIDGSVSPEQLASLPTGSGIVVGRRVEPLSVPTPPAISGALAWRTAVERTRAECGGERGSDAVEAASGPDEGDEALLLAVVVAQESGAISTDGTLVQGAAASIAGGGDAAHLAVRWSALVKRRWVLPTSTGWTLGSAGAEALGIGRQTGATRESDEHRALLLEAFRLFARRGYRLEILRQGRFDTTLPDARLELIDRETAHASPEEIARRVDRARMGWAWRFFNGRNVNVEAEVSGALRAERIRHGCRKALHEGAFILFVVADAVRARRVRAVLRDLGLGPDRAQVWTLAGAQRARPAPSGTR